MRLDFWLWAVRAFKTRSLAADAIRRGAVRVDGQPAKPAHTVRAGHRITVRMDAGSVPWVRTLKALSFPSCRIGAKLVSLYMEDVTEPAEREKSMLRPSLQSGFRPQGSGRPTKLERRAINELHGL